MTCPHEYHEREASVATEGYCPICMAAEIERLRAALTELHAMVWGECSSILNEDSGGSGKLDIEIRSLINQQLRPEKS